MRQQVYIIRRENKKTNSFQRTVHIVIQREHIPTHVVWRVLWEQEQSKYLKTQVRNRVGIITGSNRTSSREIMCAGSNWAFVSVIALSNRRCKLRNTKCVAGLFSSDLIEKKSRLIAKWTQSVKWRVEMNYSIKSIRWRMKSPWPSNKYRFIASKWSSSLYFFIRMSIRVLLVSV